MKKIDSLASSLLTSRLGQLSLMRREGEEREESPPGDRECSLAESGNIMRLAHEMKTNSLKALDQWNP